MKNILILFSLFLVSISGFSQESKNTKILVYFFHGTHRCQGCINAEKGTVNALNALYKEQLDKGVIKFESVNVEESSNKALAEKYEAAWNKLLFVKNDNSGRAVELTEQAFAYGTSNPEEMNKIIKSTVDQLLK